MFGYYNLDENPMIVLLPSILLFALCITLFIREVELDRKRFIQQDRLADEHILREVEQFKKTNGAEELNC